MHACARLAERKERAMYPARILHLLVALTALGAAACVVDINDPNVCEVNGRVYADGDTGVPAPDGCNTCGCSAGELVACTERACAPADGGCFANGVYYANGTAAIPAPDGCNRCTCIDGGLACTEIGCAPSGGACAYDGVQYADGTTFPATDGCNTCTCDDGSVACTEIACASACTVFGQRYSDAVPAPDGCNTCKCVDGEAGGCTKIACGPRPIAPCGESFEGDPIQLDALRVVGDTLELDVSYSGGCESHYVRICYDPAFLESNPVQVQMRVEHDAQGDLCEAYLSETVTADLASIRDAWRDGYLMMHGTALLRFDGLPLAPYEF